MSAPTAALVADGLSRGFGARWAVSGVNLRLRAGRSLLVAGHNGAGKTTLLRLLATLLRPSAGTLQVEGVDAARDPAAARRRVGMLGHRTGLYGDLGARDNLRISGRLLGVEGLDARIDALLRRVGLADRDREPVRDFSAGMRKRLALAQVLLQDPAVVLLDEPYGQLDPAGAELVDGFLGEACAEGRAVVVATHLVERAARLVDSGLLLADGQVAWVGPAAELPAAMAAGVTP